MKNTLLYLINITALGFLEPIVRLCYREEPKVQLKKIGRMIVVPVIVFIGFILLWNALAPKHKTKSGEVPTPGVVLDAAVAIGRFEARENDKARSYTLTGEQRLKELESVMAQLEALQPELTSAAEEVDNAKAEEAAQKEKLIAPIQAKLDEIEITYTEENKARIETLKETGSSLGADARARAAYLAEMTEYRNWKDEQREIQQAMKQQITDIRSEKFKSTAMALARQTRLAEERQYLEKKIEKLGEDNREVRISEIEHEIEELKATYATATGDDPYKIANRMLITQDRLDRTIESEYAKPWTLYGMQIVRSIFCVFTGFLIGSIIAIPIGVLCGLSGTFMAAMTPFIALFKPVSPIVWLPICLIIVGGFIPDPDNNVLIQSLWKLPLVGWMKINPAFIASALTVSLCSLWATMTNTALGVASVDKDHINVARMLRLGFWQRLFKIVLPSALPLIFAGLRISLGVGWMVLIAAELLSSSEGIGKFVWDQFNNGASDSFAKMMVVVFVVGFIGLILDRIMIVFQRMVSFEGSVATV